MINLQPAIDRIRSLLDADTAASVSYAALEARLALEKVCYERLRQAHDHISHAQLRSWQPSDVIKTLIKDVDKHTADTLTLYVSEESAAPDVKPFEEDWLEVGTQVGFDGKRVGQLWNALSGLALHVKLPTSKDDHIPEYGDSAKIRKKVEEVLAELERLGKATMGFPILGETVSFECHVCRQKNKRSASLLHEGQSIFCITPTCDASWTVREENNEIGFRRETCDFACQGCGQLNCLPRRFFFEKLKFGSRAKFKCDQCGHTNYVEWRLTQVRPASESDALTEP